MPLPLGRREILKSENPLKYEMYGMRIFRGRSCHGSLDHDVFGWHVRAGEISTMTRSVIRRKGFPRRHFTRPDRIINQSPLGRP